MNLWKRSNLPVQKNPSDLFDLRRDFFDTFDQFFSPTWDATTKLEKFTPAINVKEDESKYIVEAELPGIEKKDVEISVKDRMLHLRGEKKTFNEEKKENYHRVERSYGSFYRTVPLAVDVDQDKIEANLTNGLLVIDIPKSNKQSADHQKITIK